jgi:hypothetical protein
MRMLVVPTEYRAGDPWGICQCCGFKVRLSQMQPRWDGLRVCNDDWEPRPETMAPPNVYPEGVPRPDMAPEPPDVFIVGTVRPQDL